MSLTKTTILDTLEKTAQYRGYKGLNLQSYMPLQKRREFNNTEQQQVDEHLSNVLPKLWQSKQTPLYELLSSPGKASAGILALGTALGGGAGGAFGEGKLENVGKGALVGGLAASLPAALAYYRRNQLNEDVMEQLRRLPEGATVRDLEADPAYQADLDRDAKQQALKTLAVTYAAQQMDGMGGAKDEDEDKGEGMGTNLPKTDIGLAADMSGKALRQLSRFF